MIESEEKKKSVKEKSIGDRIVNILWKVMICAVAIVALHYGRRIFIAERFCIPSDSMRPTLVPGDKVWVNKLLFGSRIYTSFKFDDHSPLKCFRMPGIRKIRPGDVICFNYPLGYDKWTKIEFKINYVYCKRVLGTPGDTIGIHDGLNWNNHYSGTIGVLENQLVLKNTPDSVLWRQKFMRTMPFTMPIWNMKNFGPLYVPGKGETIELDSLNSAIYGPVIEYETGYWPDSTMKAHTFRHDYYFALGDNSLDSNDSRYWGFIPDDFIIGIVNGYDRQKIKKFLINNKTLLSLVNFFNNIFV